MLSATRGPTKRMSNYSVLLNLCDAVMEFFIFIFVSLLFSWLAFDLVCFSFLRAKILNSKYLFFKS